MMATWNQVFYMAGSENISKEIPVDENTYWKLVWQTVQLTVLTIWNCITRQFYSNLKWREIGLKINPIFAMLLLV